MPVVVEGVEQLKRDLRKFAPALFREMNAEIKVALGEVVADARSKIQNEVVGNLYNFADHGQVVKARKKTRPFPLYNAVVIRRGLTYSLGKTRKNFKGYAALYSLLNKSHAGSILETVGTKSDGLSASGKFFVSRARGIGAIKQAGTGQDTRGRIMWAAYADNHGKALNGVMKAINKASMAWNGKYEGQIRRVA